MTKRIIHVFSKLTKQLRIKPHDNKNCNKNWRVLYSYFVQNQRKIHQIRNDQSHNYRQQSTTCTRTLKQKTLQNTVEATFTHFTYRHTCTCTHTCMSAVHETTTGDHKYIALKTALWTGLTIKQADGLHNRQYNTHA